MTVLALEFRPHSFRDVVGQRHVTAVLQAMVRTGRVPPSLLFTGSRGTGKTSMARILAAALNCLDRVNLHGMKDPADACGICDSCEAIRADRSLALEEIDAASHGLVDDVRALREKISYDVNVTHRIIVFDEAQMMSRQAFNALLRILEEPPPRTTFAMLTTESGRIPDTVVSRSMFFEFRRIAMADMVARLEHIAAAKDLAVTRELLYEIALRSEGGMRDAVMKLDQCSYVNARTVEEFRQLFGITEVGLPLLTAALDGDYSRGMAMIDEFFYRAGEASQMVADLVSAMRDVIILLSGGTPPVATQEALDERKRIARRVSLQQMVDAVVALWELKGRQRAEDGQRVNMEMAFVVLTDAVAAEPIQTEEVPETQPLRSLEQLGALVASLTEEERRVS